MLVRVDAGLELGVCNVGAEITAPDALAPGRTFERVSLTFWIDNPDLYLAPGRAFELWHGRIVGSGRLTEWIPD
jgi:hypothetical protein